MNWNTLPWWDSHSYNLLNSLPEITCPPRNQIFRALDLTPLESVKVVILGQDPYPTPGYANGLAFSVNPSIRNLPYSLRNIFKEYKNDLHYPTPRNGDLSEWARRGVLLLNTVLTTSPNMRNAHVSLGWETFTKEIIETIVCERKHVVFILWGRQAQEYHHLIPHKKHHVIRSAHPSPLSCSRGFFGSRPFSRTNAYLSEHSLEPIHWRL